MGTIKKDVKVALRCILIGGVISILLFGAVLAITLVYDGMQKSQFGVELNWGDK